MYGCAVICNRTDLIVRLSFLENSLSVRLALSRSHGSFGQTDDPQAQRGSAGSV